MKEKLKTLLESIEEVEVHGKKNVTLMAAIIPYIETLITEADQYSKIPEPAEEADTNE